MTDNAPAQINRNTGLVARLAERFGVDSEKMLTTLKATAFRQPKGSPAPTNEQMMALCVVADQYQLNPFTRELYAFPDKNNGIVPVVGVDGWSRIMNNHPQNDGMEFRESPEIVEHPKGEHHWCPAWVECVIHRKDRENPTVVREYFDECYKPAYVKNRGQANEYVVEGPWQTHTKRMLRHKAMIQAGRTAFGFGGIYDPDEAENIVDVTGEGEHRFAGKPEVAEPQEVQAAEREPEADTSDAEDAEVVSHDEAPRFSPQDLMQISAELIAIGSSPDEIAKHFGMPLEEMPLDWHSRVMEWINERKAAQE